MASLKIKNASLNYPIYGFSNMSFRKKLLNFSTGGVIKDDSPIRIIKALDNISFSLDEGDRVGLIGHNGAGKSSLLKVLAGIYEPSHGIVESEGKVVSTLNINLGMDPEATGLENIISRCLFYGLKKNKIDEYIDEIIEFTDLGNYIHLPTRVYSAGMKARLAFAAVTSIKSDILLMDEGIGAGDAAFIEKARIRLNNFISKSKILVLASHDNNLIKRFCNKAILLEKGKLIFLGSIPEAFDRYKKIGS